MQGRLLLSPHPEPLLPPCILLFSQTFGREALLATLDAVERHAAEALAARSQGQAGWWRPREAAMLALGSCAEQLQGQAGQLKVADRIQALLQSMLEQDLQVRGGWRGAEL